MDKRHLGKIFPGLDLCDVNGSKIGTIVLGSTVQTMLTQLRRGPLYDEIVEVKIGLLGLGKRLFVPLQAVADTSGNAVYLAKPKKHLDPGWVEKPAHLNLWVPRR